MDFLELGLDAKIVKVLNDLGFVEPTEVQQKTIPLLLQNKDVVGRSETGSGKTLAFALPIIQNIDRTSETIQALIVCPTRELAVQNADGIKKVTNNLEGIRVCAVFGGSSIDRQISSLKRKPQIVVGTPGRIMDLIDRKALKISSLRQVVLDEADEMLDMGFVDDIKQILKSAPEERQTILFSATIPTGIKEIIKKFQNESVYVEIGAENQALDKIKQEYIFVSQNKKQTALVELFKTDVFGKTIVFTNTKSNVDILEKCLSDNNIKCAGLHGDKRQNDRRKVMDAFKNGSFDILIATDVAARGIDVKEVQYIVNYDLPQQLEYYVHRIGRTARAGKSGMVIDIIANMTQLSYLKQIERETKAKIEPYITQNENLTNLYCDTQKLAKEESRFGEKSPRSRSYSKNRFDRVDSTKGNRESRYTRGDKSEKSGFNRSNREDGGRYKRAENSFDRGFSARRKFSFGGEDGQNVNSDERAHKRAYASKNSDESYQRKSNDRYGSDFSRRPRTNRNVENIKDDNTNAIKSEKYGHEFEKTSLRVDENNGFNERRPYAKKYSSFDSAKRYDKKDGSVGTAKRYDRKSGSFSSTGRYDRKDESNNSGARFDKKDGSVGAAKRYDRKDESFGAAKRYDRKDESFGAAKRYDRKSESFSAAKRYETRSDRSEGHFGKTKTITENKFDSGSNKKTYNEKDISKKYYDNDKLKDGTFPKRSYQKKYENYKDKDAFDGSSLKPKSSKKPDYFGKSRLGK